jgi:hypothetical protein
MAKPKNRKQGEFSLPVLATAALFVVVIFLALGVSAVFASSCDSAPPHHYKIGDYNACVKYYECMLTNSNNNWDTLIAQANADLAGCSDDAACISTYSTALKHYTAAREREISGFTTDSQTSCAPLQNQQTQPTPTPTPTVCSPSTPCTAWGTCTNGIQICSAGCSGVQGCERKNGADCTDFAQQPVSTQCASGICAIQNDNTMKCEGKPNGFRCDDPNQCVSGICTSNNCTGKSNGITCAASKECSSLSCISSACQPKQTTQTTQQQPSQVQPQERQTVLPPEEKAALENIIKNEGKIAAAFYTSLYTVLGIKFTESTSVSVYVSTYASYTSDIIRGNIASAWTSLSDYASSHVQSATKNAAAELQPGNPLYQEEADCATNSILHPGSESQCQTPKVQ